ncbi:cupin [Rhodococcus sp. WMMA185]|uniref:cupin domain-containing protein n=1 Tax=Rhodococcus sp. WMMA185 TaxID=679318 RepID=UPI000878F324|nr:cupin domain-containing protein [Rhodococcus sp. WMMA185]AOW92690.1 cupin [Rhodococcus sp. WMMA185]
MISKPILATLTCAAAAVLPAFPAGATPSSGVSAQTLLETTVPAVGTSEATVLTLRRIAIAPGGTTGWHYHDGPVYAYVESGTLTRTLQDCTIVTTTKGQTVAEGHGSNQVHMGANLGTAPLVLLALYVQPEGDPLSENASDPRC